MGGAGFVGVGLSGAGLSGVGLGGAGLYLHERKKRETQRVFRYFFCALLVGGR
ncbi:hypothetical protein [Bartonella jaculi]|uniref:hypothetical protein n=1 Tax=Bartonella jaculi TaxID=686226 RepID=UPI0031E8F07D